MANINKADGSSIKSIYDFLLSIQVKDYTLSLEKFTVTIEDNINKNKRQESFNTIESFLERFAFVLEKISPQCDTGPYFRLTKLNIKTNKNENSINLKYYYDSDNNNWKYYHTIEKKSVESEYYLNELLNHSKKQEFLISYRKARYVDPCYMDEGYIEEKYKNFY